MDTNSVSVTSGAAPGRAFRAFTSFLSRRCGKVLVLSIWLLLVLLGLLIFRSFLEALLTTVPPVKGSASYEALEVHDHFFSTGAINSAFLCESGSGEPFVSFVDKSTCQPHFSQENFKTFTITCSNNTALGGGCLTTAQLVTFLEQSVEKTLRQLPFLNASQIEQVMQEFKEKALPELSQEMPTITQCPTAVNEQLTGEWLNFAQDVNKRFEDTFPQCDQTMQSFPALPAKSINKSLQLPFAGTNFTVQFMATLPGGTFWELLEDQLLADSGKTTLFAASTASCDGQALEPNGKMAKSIASLAKTIAEGAPDILQARVSSQTLMMDAIQSGIKQTMDLSTMTLPLALLILAGMAGNVRLLICTLVNLVACLMSAILLMYPIALSTPVSTTTTPLMIAVALAMSIDYSLFMLTRFQKEANAGRPNAVEIMMKTSGKIVLVSGVTLLVCFLMMLSLPVQFIAFMGVSAAITVLMAVLAALTITPVLLLAFPVFFASDRRCGLSAEGCCQNAENDATNNVAAGVADANTEASQRQAILQDDLSCWLRFGERVQKWKWPTLLLLLIIATPFAIGALPKFAKTAGLVPFMPSNSPATDTVLALQDAFGAGALFPTTLVLVPPEAAVSDEDQRKHWLANTCAALKSIAASVNADISDLSMPSFTPSAFVGVMILNGNCTQKGLGQWSHIGRPYSATQVLIEYAIDPFSHEGGLWIGHLRDAVKQYEHLGAWYVYGEGPNQLDASNITFAKFPVMIVLMMVVVLLIIGAAFKSVIAPLRAVFCLMWMLLMTFSLAIFVYQDGWLSFLHLSQLGRREGGAMSWMSPCISCSVIIGLGLDYDIFYSESIIEHKLHGYSDSKAAVHALKETANTISAAGLIMAIAFSSLLFSSTPTLNEIAFLLIVGVLIDCFVTTKIIIPAAMALLDGYNFWPRKFADSVSPSTSLQASNVETI